MPYERKKIKLSQSTDVSALDDSSTIITIKDGANTEIKHSDYRAQLKSELLPNSLINAFEDSAAIIASDLQSGDFAQDMETGRVYEITNLAAEDFDLTLNSGLTATLIPKSKVLIIEDDQTVLGQQSFDIDGFDGVTLMPGIHSVKTFTDMQSSGATVATIGFNFSNAPDYVSGFSRALLDNQAEPVESNNFNLQGFSGAGSNPFNFSTSVQKIAHTFDLVIKVTTATTIDFTISKQNDDGISTTIKEGSYLTVDRLN